jgi:catechol 2,3-dioxygenase-like lactoylglutathione lyase family enzyme
VTAGALRVGHVGLLVSDLERSLAFWVGVVGLRLTERLEYPEGVGHGAGVAAAAFLRSDAAHHSIALFVPRAGLPEAGRGLHHLAFDLPTPEALLAKLHAMRAAGVAIEDMREGGPGNQPRFYVRDPDGTLVEFYWGLDDIGWDGRPRPYGPITSIDLEAFDFRAFEATRDAAG